MDAAVAAPEGLNGIDLSTGNKEVGDTNADDEASGGLAGSLTGLVTVGADEPCDHQPVADQQHAAGAVLAGRGGHLRRDRRGDRHADGDGGRAHGVHAGGERGDGDLDVHLLDHSTIRRVSTEDNLVLSFDATVTDGDGDEVVQTLSVNVDDDMPTLGTAGTLAVDEDDLLAPPASFAGNSDVSAGDDLADPSPTSVSASLGVALVPTAWAG